MVGSRFESPSFTGATMPGDDVLAPPSPVVKALCILVFVLMAAAMLYSGWIGIRYFGAIHV